MNNLALEALGNAIKLGYNDLGYIKQDPDLDNLRKDKYYREFIDKFKNSKSRK